MLCKNDVVNCVENDEPVTQSVYLTFFFYRGEILKK